MGKSPDKIVADIDAAQNKEDLELPKRIGEAVVKGAKAVKDKVKKDLTGGAYVGNKLNMGNTPAKKEVQRQNDIINDAEFHSDYGKKAGGVIKSSASKRADGCAIRGKTRA
jgi:hypothetical protein